MNRLVLLLAGSVVVFGLVFFMFQDDLITANSNSSNGNIKTTAVEVNLNCPVDASVITNLIEVYADNSCPRITVRRLDLKAPNEVVITPTISWLNNFRASLFPLTKDDLIDDIESFKSKAITPELEKLLSAKQGSSASCDYQNIRENFRFRDTDMYANNLTYYVNRAVAEGKSKVVFKVLSCPIKKKLMLKEPGKPEIEISKKQDVSKKTPNIQRGDNTNHPSKIIFDYIAGSNTIQWDKRVVSILSNKTFEFEFQYQRGGKWIKSGKIQFAVSDIGKKVISTQEILNAGGQDFINHCHNKSCQLTIFERGKEYQRIQVSSIDCNDFHK
jgi:hypothetical protein